MVDKHVLYNIIKIIAFLTILLVLVLGVQREFIPFQFQDTIQARTFANYTEEDSVDVLIVGTSSIMVGISPLRIYQDAQITSHVRGNSRQPPQVLYLDVKDALRTQKPKLVVCSAAMVLSDFNVDEEEVRVRRGMDYLPLTIDKIKVACAVVKESEWQTLSSFIIPLTRYHSRWTDIKEGLQRGNRDEYDFKHGQYAVYRTEPQVDNTVEKMKDKTPVEVSESSMYWYKKVSELCRENGMEFLLVTTPDQRWTMGKHNSIEQAAKSIGADYLDYNVDGIIEECGLNWQTDFYDDHHANAGGSIKQTDYLVKYMQDKYNLKASEISDSTRKRFEEDVEHFNEVLERRGYI